ncbi:MAG TPA: hypothetical protein VGD78_01420 [Chthoniobacterales bacterium]
MNYRELATALEQLAHRLSKHADKLEGEALGSQAHRLLEDARKVAAQVDAHLASRKSGEWLLETLLRSPGAKRHLTLNALRKLVRETLGKRLKADALPAAKRELIDLAHAQASGQAVADALRGYLSEAASVKTGKKEKDALQQEFVALGSLSDEEFREAAGNRHLAELRRLASANGIPFTPKTPKVRLLHLIRHYGQRAVVNLMPPV